MVLGVEAGGGLRSASRGTPGVRRARHLADCLDNLQEPVIERCVLDHGFAVRGHGHERAERGAVPVAGTKDDGDDARFTAFVAFHRTHHLDVMAVVGGEEVCADKQQNDICGVELFVDLAV